MADRQTEQSGHTNRLPMGGANTGDQTLRLGLLCKSILGSLPIGIVTFDAGLKVLDTNEKAESLIDLVETIDESLKRGTNKPGAAGIDWSQQLAHTIDAGRIQRFDSVNYTYNARTSLLDIICVPVVDPVNQRIIAGTVIIEEVTEKVTVQRQLARAEKLATIGKLASKVAHELNNPMDGILRYINLSLRTIENEDLEKPREYLLQCRQGIMRMVNIVTELLEFSRSTHAPFEYVRLEHIIDDALKTMAGRAETQAISVEKNYSQQVPEVRTGNLFQIFCNLIKNAYDAMPDGGLLAVTTSLSGGNNDIAVIEFTDSGTGFDVADSAVIFEPFYTTKAKGQGTGLGLAICKDIVERAGGRITAESNPQGGSLFTVFLPLTDQIQGGF